MTYNRLPMKRAIAVLFVCALSAFGQETYDLVVYGGTAGGVLTAVSGAREGLKGGLLEPGAHLGGIATGGPSRTDFGQNAVIRRYALEIYLRVRPEDEIQPVAPDVSWLFQAK